MVLGEPLTAEQQQWLGNAGARGRQSAGGSSTTCSTSRSSKASKLELAATEFSLGAVLEEDSCERSAIRAASQAG